jgi:integrase
VSPSLIEQFYADLEKAGASPRSRQMAGVVLGTALQHAVHPLKLIDHNPCADVPKPRVVRKEMHVWDHEQVRRFLDAGARDRLAALYVVAIDTGARQGELFALRWDDVDFAAGTIRIQRSLVELHGNFEIKEPKTKAGRRTVQVSSCSLDALNQHRQHMLAEGPDVRVGLVFCDNVGGFLRKSNIVRRSFRYTMKQAGVPTIRFHDLRHYAASLLLAAGINPLVIKERLGHERVETTLAIYSHLMPSAQAEAANKMDKVFAKPTSTNPAAAE